MATYKATATNPWTASKGRLDMLFLSEPDMFDAGVKDIATCMNTIEEVFLTLHNEDLSPGHNVDVNPQFSAAPAFLGGRFNRSGCRWSGFSYNNQAMGFPPGLHMYLLNDGSTTEPLAIMSGNLLSAYCTGAVTGVGVRYLATLDASTTAVIGNGPIAKTTLTAIVDARPSLSTLRIFDDGTGRSLQFAEWAKDNFPQLDEVVVVDSIKHTLRDADIVAFCTRAELAEIQAEWIPEGSLVTAWGSVTFAETTAEKAQVLSDTGTALSPIIANEAPRRTKSDETFVLHVTPNAAAEVAWASHVYDHALSQSIGSSLNLWETPELD